MSDIAVEQQQEKLKSFSDGFYASHLISIGAECGLFETINNQKAATPAEIAVELGLHEPYIEIWCQTAYHYQLLDLDKEGKYILQPHMDELLVDKTSLKYQTAAFRMSVSIAGERLVNYPQHYKSGGITEEYSAERSKLLAAASDLGTQIRLLYFNMLPDEDRLKRKLIQPFKFLDIGCGSGGFIIRMAQTYQDGLFWGVDPVPHGIKTAKKQIKRLGLDNQVFVEQAGGEQITYNKEFDIASLFITFHEIPPNNRQTVMEKVYQSLKQDGLLLMIDFAYPSKIEDFRSSAYEPGVIDQFMETTLGIKHLTAEEQDEMFAGVGFKDIQRTPRPGMDIITALK